MNTQTADATITYPFLGFGLGLRPDHYHDILEQKPDVDWFEAITENYLVDGGKPMHFLERVRENFPIVLHGVSLSIGSSDPLNVTYLERVKRLAARIEPRWISDHLCWTGIHGINSHDLLPLPQTEEALTHVVSRVKRVQDVLGRRILLENVSSYVTFTENTMNEWEFLSEVAERADCLILLDINNIFVSAFNHKFDPMEYLNGVPGKRIQQFHLAGHSRYDDHIIDTHDHPVPKDVWELLIAAARLFGPVSCMIERDDNIPPLAELVTELHHARELVSQTVGGHRE